MRRYFLLIITLILTTSCSRPDVDTSAQVQAWLESLGPNAKVIEVWCKGNVEQPPGSGIWKEFEFDHQLSAWEVLEGAENRGLEWNKIVARMIEITKVGFPDWVAIKMGLTEMQRLAFKASARVKDLTCDGKALRSPPIQIGKCPNDINGCDEPPMATDLPPLPPPDPGGGGDF